MPRKTPTPLDPAARVGYSVPEACAAIGISRVKLYQLMKQGRLGFCKVGTRRIITRAQIERCLDECEVA